MKNLDFLVDIVDTKYSDMQGLISIDGHNKAFAFELCSDHGINMDKYFLFGFGFGDETFTGVGQHDTVYCKALLLDMERYGRTYEEIKSNIMNLSKVYVIKKTFKVYYSDLGKYIKQFDFMTLCSISEYISSIEIKNEE